MTLTPEYLATLREQIDRRLVEVYPQGPRLLAEPIHYVLAGGGKRLRPILTLITAQALGATTEQVLHAAVAVEILHNFTLVHDDVMDRDNTRHGQPTVHSRWDEGVAILTGDAMFINALGELYLTSGDVAAQSTAFIQGALAVCEGQALDKEYESRPDVSQEEYRRMIDLKTGHMLGLAAELGALVAESKPDYVEGVRRYGRLLGRAFQIQDDLLEVFSDSRTMGKSLGSDLLSDKKTYLVVAGMEVASEQVLKAMTLAKQDLEAGMDALRTVLEQNGIRADAEEVVKQTIGQALDELAPLGELGQLLVEFSDLVLNRRK
ncbi:MAG: polyprenyl synthetase family protein [Candidatus Neomarinimicrobiota bacterium]